VMPRIKTNVLKTKIKRLTLYSITQNSFHNKLSKEFFFFLRTVAFFLGTFNETLERTFEILSRTINDFPS